MKEAVFLKMCDKRFGSNLFSRAEKLKEEISELLEVINMMKMGDTSPSNIEHLKDEISDVQGVLTHLSSIAGLTFNQCLMNVEDKIRGRESDPNYKRF